MHMIIISKFGCVEARSNNFHDVMFISETLSKTTKKQHTRLSSSKACNMKSKQNKITLSSKSGSYLSPSKPNYPVVYYYLFRFLVFARALTDWLEGRVNLVLLLLTKLRLVWDLLRARFLRSKIASIMSTLSSTLLNYICELIVYSFD